MKRILLTGIGGFLGTHCLEYFLEKTDWEIIGLDSFRNKGTWRRMQSARHEYSGSFDDRVKIYKHDITCPIDKQLENLIFEKRIDDRGNVTQKKIDYIFNLASDSAVERSTTDPVYCMRNNYELMITMLEFARIVKPSLFIQCSTDEVYGEAISDPHKEWSRILPSNPYAASKAAQEALCISYWRTYDLPLVITNCMNLIGERQDPEKFLPKLINFVYSGKEMPIYGDSLENIGSRFYLYAKNYADSLIFISKIKPSMYTDGNEVPDRYNVCGDVEINNLQMGQLIAKMMNKDLKYKLVPSESARKGYDRRYALNGDKLRSLGWIPSISFEDGIKKTIDWTLENREWLF